MESSSSITEAKHLLAKQKKNYLIVIALLGVVLIGLISSTTYLGVKLNRAYPPAQVKYHVWSHPNALTATANENKLKLKVPDNATVFSLMEHGAKENSRLRFEFTNFGFGRYITSIGGVKENLDENQFWILYKLDDSPNANSPPGTESMAQFGIDDMRVSDGDVYLFWLRNLGDIEYPETLTQTERKLTNPCSTGQVL